MRIAVIGAGNVGATLGNAWSAAGHQVTYGVRKPDPASTAEKTVGEAAAGAEVVVLATPWPAVDDAVAACGDLTGRILVDCTNPLLPGLAGLEVGTTTSGVEKIAELAPGAKAVKAFNTVGFNVMANPTFDGKPVSMLYCGDDPDAKAIVRQLIADCGFEPVDAGPLKQARLLEPFALLWISMAMQYGYSRDIAFRFVRR